MKERSKKTRRRELNLYQSRKKRKTVNASEEGNKTDKCPQRLMSTVPLKIVEEFTAKARELTI